MFLHSLVSFYGDAANLTLPIHHEGILGLFDGTLLERPVLCDRCEKDIQVCKCPPMDIAPEKQRLQIKLEKRKNGRLVTLVTGFLCSETQIQELFTFLKSQCGAGGSSGPSSLEIQGDHLQRLEKLIAEKGYVLPKSRKP